MIIRKTFIVVCLAYFVSSLILWGFFGVPFTSTVAVLAILFCCYTLIKDFVLLLYIEQNMPEWLE